MSDDWMYISIQLPQDDGAALILLLREKLGFTEVDWCELQRPDLARATYAPCEPVQPPATNPFSQTTDAEPPPTTAPAADPSS